MSEDTQQFAKPVESKAFNISIRAWIALMVVFTVCFMSIMAVEIKEPLYTLAGMVIGYYYAQKEKPKSQS
jgi:hypothetical protein